MPIPDLPLFKHRDTVITPADQNQFVTQFETTMDTMSNDVIPAINLATTDINEKVITATTARDESEDARDIAVAAKDEALTAVATLQAGAIDNTVIAPNKAFSNQYTNDNFVKLTGNETIDDVKTFTSSPIVPTPTTDGDVANKEYVDNNSDIGAITSYSQISGTNVIEGVELTNNIHDVFNDGSAVATYHLNGNANDLGGTYNGVATNVTYGKGKFGQCGVFSDDLNSVITTNVYPTQTFTLSFWANIQDVSKSLNGGVCFGATLFGIPASIFFEFNFHNNTIRCQTSNGSTVSGIDYDATGQSGKWIHLLAIGNTNSWSFYVNGVLVGSNIFTYRNITTESLRIGASVNGYGLNGSIDQVRIFKRALTEQEVQTLYTETRVSGSVDLNINQGTFIYPKGLTPRGYLKSSDTFTGSVPTSGVSNGWKYVAKDENNNFSFYDTKPTLGKTSAELYLKDGKLYKSSDDTEITPISFLSNRVRFASGVPQELSPSGIAKNVTDTIEAKEVFGKNAILAYALIDMTATPPTILDSYNISSVTRISNGVGKVILEVPTDKDNVTAICSSNAGTGSVTATTKSEISFATGTTNYAKTSVMVIGGKF